MSSKNLIDWYFRKIYLLKMTISADEVSNVCVYESICIYMYMFICVYVYVYVYTCTLNRFYVYSFKDNLQVLLRCFICVNI